MTLFYEEYRFPTVVFVDVQKCIQVKRFDLKIFCFFKCWKNLRPSCDWLLLNSNWIMVFDSCWKTVVDRQSPLFLFEGFCWSICTVNNCRQTPLKDLMYEYYRRAPLFDSYSQPFHKCLCWWDQIGLILLFHISWPICQSLCSINSSTASESCLSNQIKAMYCLAILSASAKIPG